MIVKLWNSMKCIRLSQCVTVSFYSCGLAVSSRLDITTIVLKKSHADIHPALTRSGQLTFLQTEDKGHRLPGLQRSSLSPLEALPSLRLQLPLHRKLPERDILVVQLPVSHPSSCKWPRKLMVSAEGTWTVFSLVCHCSLYLERPDVSPSPPGKAMRCSHYVP